jgi:mediator of RNA polymerase II transcription subunit 7
MMVAANQLRGVQAEATLVLMMEKQVETRRAQTEALKLWVLFHLSVLIL